MPFVAHAVQGAGCPERLGSERGAARRPGRPCNTSDNRDNQWTLLDIQAVASVFRGCGGLFIRLNICMFFVFSLHCIHRFFLKITSDQTRELLRLLVELDGLSKAAAKQVLNGIALDSRFALLHELRQRKLERSGQARLPLGRLVDGVFVPAKPAERASKAKKVPYTLLLPPEQLDALRALAERDDSSVSHHIRQAIRAYLRSRPV